jgi:hypothetical protein
MPIVQVVTKIVRGISRQTLEEGGSVLDKEGWPLLTVETEVNGNSKSTNGLFVRLVVSIQEIFVLPWLL